MITATQETDATIFTSRDLGWRRFIFFASTLKNKNVIEDISYKTRVNRYPNKIISKQNLTLALLHHYLVDREGLEEQNL